MSLGAVLVPLNVRLTLSEQAWLLDDVGAKMLIHDQAYALRAQELVATLSEVVPALVTFDYTHKASCCQGLNP